MKTLADYLNAIPPSFVFSKISPQGLGEKALSCLQGAVHSDKIFAVKFNRLLRKLMLLISIMVIKNWAYAQQDAQFSQYMFNGIYINPAYAGYKEQLNAHAFYRNQFVGVDGAPQTMSLAIDAIANKGNVGLALQISNDIIGAQRNLSVYANYAYRLRLNGYNDERLAFGLGVGAIQLGIDGALLNPNDFENQQPPGMQSTIVPDARAGVYFANDRFYAGLSVDNLIPQLVSMSNYPFIIKPKPHYYLTAGMLVPLNENIQLKPSFLIKDDRGGPTSLDLSTFFILNDKIWLGGAYRTAIKLYSKSYLQNDLRNMSAAVAAAQFFASDTFRIGYAYDFSAGGLSGNLGGSHEISISFLFKKTYLRVSNPRPF
ncbi:PorP/SprF family type IX secretion system membrane protein [Pedobacter nanyangensis]|uniref:PorP/SprF family type IX secretion system membrane protein n=1 Tax=Pedobacter nanyangensis TaxID=1562389 RepID=UPI001F057539|nr:type IX secretion system membrane protein PorP/SprF [Pedobacter nanyangensis]